MTFFNKPIFQNKRFILAVFILFSLFAAIQQILLGSINNYYIFKYVYYHLIEYKNLYSQYPLEYFDSNHYGPVFGLLIAPFALLPDWLGVCLWNLFNTLLLFYAISKLPLSNKNQAFIYWFVLIEFMTAEQNLQTNPIIAALFILTFIMFEKEKPFWAAFFITLGGFIKLYPFLGAAFFLLYPQKGKFLLSMILWSIVIFALPLLVVSPQQLIINYQQFYSSLAQKIITNHQISLTGLIKFNLFPNISSFYVMGIGVLIFISAYLRKEAFEQKTFKLLFMSSVLIWSVIFSPGAESPTYIIAMTGVAIWFVVSEKNTLNIGLVIFAFILTSLSPTDIIPHHIRYDIIQAHALKALPVVLIWFKVIYQLLLGKTSKANV
jgi:hypothetical protein